ncbi:hypothetical protein HYS50_04030 [Candidatus Woesearchaeota archaeon]|nr:hypothetical protein [Candidatus Woesearchaeota archaeon]
MTDTPPEEKQGIQEVKSLLAKRLAELAQGDLAQQIAKALQLIIIDDEAFEPNKEMIYQALVAGYDRERIKAIPCFATYEPPKNNLLGKLLGGEKPPQKTL